MTKRQDEQKNYARTLRSLTMMKGCPGCEGGWMEQEEKERVRVVIDEIEVKVRRRYRRWQESWGSHDLTHPTRSQAMLVRDALVEVRLDDWSEGMSYRAMAERLKREVKT